MQASTATKLSSRAEASGQGAHTVIDKEPTTEMVVAEVAAAVASMGQQAVKKQEFTTDHKTMANAGSMRSEVSDAARVAVRAEAARVAVRAEAANVAARVAAARAGTKGSKGVAAVERGRSHKAAAPSQPTPPLQQTLLDQFGEHRDMYLWGVEPLGQLLWRGDLRAMRTGVVKVLDGHRRLLAQVQQAKTSANEVAYEVYQASVCFVTALLVAGEFDALRQFLHHSLVGASLIDKAVRDGMASLWVSYGWNKTDSLGHRHSSHSTWEFLVRGLHTLVGDDNEATRHSLRSWLPQAAELLFIVESESGWRTQSIHPALLCARLHGERLNNWVNAAVVAEGVLSIQQSHPLQRIEAHRLAGKANAALGDRDAACEAVERAVAEAAGARYLWLAMLSLRDELRWCGPSEAASVRSRLRGVAGRLSVTPEELVEVLGSDVLV